MTTWRQLATELDQGSFEVSEWESNFLETMLRWRGTPTPRQLLALTRMVEKYLSLEAAAELRGQLRFWQGTDE